MACGGRAYESDAEGWFVRWGAEDNDRFLAVTADERSRIYAAGHTGSRPEGGGAALNVVVAHFTDVGALGWQSLIGTDQDDAATSVVAANGDVFVAGFTAGALGRPNAGDRDSWAARLDGNTGTTRWLSQWGSSAWDAAGQILTTGNGVVLVAGETDAVPSAGETDVFVTSLDASSGRERWHVQWGGPGNDYVRHVALGAAGEVYVAVLEVEGPSNTSGHRMVVRTMDVESGTQRASVAFTPSSSQELSLKATIDKTGNLYVLAETSSTISKVSGQTGELLWQTAVTSETPSAPPSNHRLAIESSGELLLASGDSKEARLAWFKPTNGQLLALRRVAWPAATLLNAISTVPTRQGTSPRPTTSGQVLLAGFLTPNQAAPPGAFVALAEK